MVNTPAREPSRRPRIVLAVTSAVSLILMKGLPAAFSDAGWEVHVVCAPQAGGVIPETVGDVTVHGVPMMRAPSPRQDIRSCRAWVKLLRRLRPEVVFAGTPKAGLLGISTAWLVRVPTRVYHMRGLRLETTTGIARVLFWVLERVTIALATSVVCVSPSLRQRALQLRLGSPRKFVVLGAGSSNGVDTERFHPAREQESGDARFAFGLDSDAPVIGFVGRFHADKGIDVLLRASALLRDRGVPHQLLLVGGADDQTTAAAITRRSASSGVRCVVPGHLADTAAAYQAMDVFCLPSLREGFPNVVLEASASGLPTVTTDATGCVDAVADGVTGYRVAVGDAEALAEGLSQLLQDPDRRRSFGRAARTFVCRSFERSQVQRELVTYFEPHLPRPHVVQNGD